MGDNKMGDNKMDDNALGDNALGDNAPGDNAPGDNAVGDNAINNNKMGDNKKKIGIMAGVLVVLIAGFFLVNMFVLKSNTPPAVGPSASSSKPISTPVASPSAPNVVKPGAAVTGTQPGANNVSTGSKPSSGNAKIAQATPSTPAGSPKPTTSPGGQPVAKPAGQPVAKPAGQPVAKPVAKPTAKMPAAKPVAAKPIALPPPKPVGLPKPPPPALPPAPIVAAVFDPFAGGPNPPPPPKKIPPPVWPSMVMTTTMPPMRPQKIFTVEPGTPFLASGAPVEPPIGRMAGWIFNTNGQIIAIFEDVDGVTHSLRAGDPVGNYRVTTITPEYMMLMDANHIKHKVKLQGLDSYAGGSRTVNVVATPTGTPAWNH